MPEIKRLKRKFSSLDVPIYALDGDTEKHIMTSMSAKMSASRKVDNHRVVSQKCLSMPHILISHGGGMQVFYCVDDAFN